MQELEVLAHQARISTDCIANGGLYKTTDYDSQLEICSQANSSCPFYRLNEDETLGLCKLTSDYYERR